MHLRSFLCTVALMIVSVSFFSLAPVLAEDTETTNSAIHKKPHVDPMAAPGVPDENQIVPEKGHRQSLKFSSFDQNSKPHRKQNKLPAKKAAAIKAQEDAKALADSNTAITLGVPRMQNSVYELTPPNLNKTKSPQMGITLSSYEPRSYTPPSTLQNTTRFTNPVTPELTLTTQQNGDWDSFPLLSKLFSVSYLHLQRTGTDNLPGENLKLSQDLNLVTLKLGAINEWQIHRLGSQVRPFLGATVNFAWAQSGTGAFDNGINQTAIGLGEMAGVNYHSGSWHASLGLDNRTGISFSGLNGYGLFTGISRDLE